MLVQDVRHIWMVGYVAAAGSLLGRGSTHTTLPLQHATNELVRYTSTPTLVQTSGGGGGE